MHKHTLNNTLTLHGKIVLTILIPIQTQKWGNVKVSCTPSLVYFSGYSVCSWMIHMNNKI